MRPLAAVLWLRSWLRAERNEQLGVAVDTLAEPTEASTGAKPSYAAERSSSAGQQR
jgi:hypothetical protein